MPAPSQPFSFILFGASGHLARIKIYPALYVLALKIRLPKEYAIVGYARSAMDDDTFRALVATSIRESMPEVTEKALQEFLSNVFYQRGSYDKTADFRKLSARLDRLESGWKNEIRPTLMDNAAWAIFIGTTNRGSDGSRDDEGNLTLPSFFDQ